ncbi:hypothetical protein B566_EDAN006995 [Ephemera danica]|nr:hypothetical protein B566_EDAN006995 [Ephemera danica]
MSRNSKHIMKRGTPLSRSVSMRVPEDYVSDKIDVLPLQSATATASMFDRWKSMKRRMQSSYSTPNISITNKSDDVVYEELNLTMSSDEHMDNEDRKDHPEKISNDRIRKIIQNTMINIGGKMEILTAIESNNCIIRSLLNSCNPNEKNVALLWACFLRRYDLIAMLVQEADIGFYTHEKGLTALHLAAYSASPNCVEFLLKKGALNSKPKSLTPLHCAAMGNSTKCIELLLNTGDYVNLNILNRNDYSSTQATVDAPLHSAICANAIDSVALLLDLGADAAAIGDIGLSAFHLAAHLGFTECLKTILNLRRGIDVNAKAQDRWERSSILHFAANSGQEEMVRLLLSHGVDPNHVNSKGQTALHIAAKMQAVDCVKILIQNCDVNVVDADGRTALHIAVERANRAAETVEVLCSAHGVIDLNISDKYGRTALHIAATNELPIVAAILIRSGADMSARTKRGATAMGHVIRKAPAASYAIEEVLNKAIRIGVETCRENDIEDTNRDKVVELKLNFHPLLVGKNRIEVSLLSTFIAEGQKALLQHPLCKAFLHLKWQTIRKFYFLRLFLNDSLELPISEYVFEIIKCVVNWGVLVLALLEILRKSFGLVSVISAPTVRSVLHGLKNYVCQIDNILEWFTFISVFLISNLFWQSKRQWQEHLGPFAVLFGWTNLMMMVGQLPLFRSYVSMYTCVLREFAKLLLAYFCLLIGFAISFCVIFREAKEFSNPLIALVKVFVMMTGELEFNDLLLGKNHVNTTAESHEEKYLSFTTPIIFVACLLLLTVALMNLLVAIAVHDIKGLRVSAGLSKLENQAVLVSYVETALSVLSYGCCSSVFSTKLTRNVITKKFRANSTLLRLETLNQEDMLSREIVQEAYELAKRCNNFDKKVTLDTRYNGKQVLLDICSNTTGSKVKLPDKIRYGKSESIFECTATDGADVPFHPTL